MSHTPPDEKRKTKPAESYIAEVRRKLESRGSRPSGASKARNRGSARPGNPLPPGSHSEPEGLRLIERIQPYHAPTGRGSKESPMGPGPKGSPRTDAPHKEHRNRSAAP